MSEILIDGRAVGPGHSPYIVAEAGINHNGEVVKALEMVNAAKQAGAHAIKFQTFKADQFVNDSSQMFAYRSQGREVTESMLAMFRRYELPESAWSRIKAECVKTGIAFFSTPQNRSDLEILLRVGIPAVKIGSDDFTNLPLLKSYAGSGLPLILSSGMSDMAEAHQALEVVGALDGYPVILLVCTSQYPTPPGDANLARITSLRAAFPGVAIGFSDHTQGPLAAAIAVALGACLLEKHFTLDHNLPGPDHWFSEDPTGLTAWVAAIRDAALMMGTGQVRPSEMERGNKLEYQRRLVAARDIAPGEIIDEGALTLRRVAGGRGLPPSLMPYLIGHAALRAFRAGEPIEL